VGGGAFAFFIGGLCYFAANRLRERGVSDALVMTHAGLTLLSWVFIPNLLQGDFAYDLYRRHIWTESLDVFGKDLIGSLVRFASRFSFQLLVFPLTILTLALWEMRRGTLGRRLAFLGDISYSSYLLHFPLQMAFVILAAQIALPSSAFYHPASLVLFFAVLIPLCLLSYRFVERPCQGFLRRRFLPSSAARTGVGSEAKASAPA
jgi:peptidoglycan/LPS O-acetylase OafA/YrhL